MSTSAQEDLKSYVFPKTDDPVVRARQRMIAEWAVESSPEMRDKLVGEGRVEEARSSLRHVLALRGLTLSAEQEARIRRVRRSRHPAPLARPGGRRRERR